MIYRSGEMAVESKKDGEGRRYVSSTLTGGKVYEAHFVPAREVGKLDTISS